MGGAGGQLPLPLAEDQLYGCQEHCWVADLEEDHDSVPPHDQQLAPHPPLLLHHQLGATAAAREGGDGGQAGEGGKEG